MAATEDHHHHHRGGVHDAANPRTSADSDNIELGSLDARDDEPFLPGDDGDGDGIAAASPSYPARSGSGKKPRVIWLTAFFLMNSLAFGIAVVPRVNLVVSLICRQTLPAGAEPVVVGGFNPQCQVDAVSATTAMVQSAGNVVSGVLSMGVSAFLNALSDRVGRVRVIAYAAAVLGAVEVVMVVLAKTPVGTSYRWLYLAYTLDGLSGSFATVMAMASAYISDCVDEEKRNVEVGRMHGAMFIGIAVGPAISSAIVAGSGQKSPLLVFYLGIAMRVVSLVYLMAFVSESLPQARKGFRSAFSMPSTTRWQQITRPAKGVDVILSKLDKVNPSKWLDRLVPSGSTASRRLRRNVIILIAINIICYAGAMATGDVLILYPQVVFKWGNVENNMFMSVINGFRAAVSTLGIPLLIAVFRKRKPQFGRHSEPTHDQSLPHPEPAPLTTSTTTPSTMLDPSAFPDLDALTSPTTPQTTTFPPSDPDSPLATRPTTTTTTTIPTSGALDPLDRTLILTALLFDIFGYLGYALSPNGIIFTLCGAAAAFGAVGLSTSEAALTKCVQPSSPNAAVPHRSAKTVVSESRVGELMAGLGMLQSVVRIVAPALVNVVYGATVAEGHPGTAFLGVAGVLGVGVGLTTVLVVG